MVLEVSRPLDMDELLDFARKATTGWPSEVHHGFGEIRGYVNGIRVSFKNVAPGVRGSTGHTVVITAITDGITPGFMQYRYDHLILVLHKIILNANVAQTPLRAEPQPARPQPATNSGQPAAFNYGQNFSFSTRLEFGTPTTDQMDRFVGLFENEILKRVSRPIHRKVTDHDSGRGYTLRDSAGNVVATVNFHINQPLGIVRVGGSTGTGITAMDTKDISYFCAASLAAVHGVPLKTALKPSPQHENLSSASPQVALPPAQMYSFVYTDPENPIRGVTAKQLDAFLESSKVLFAIGASTTVERGRWTFGSGQSFLKYGETVLMSVATNDAAGTITISIDLNQILRIMDGSRTKESARDVILDKLETALAVTETQNPAPTGLMQNKAAPDKGWTKPPGRSDIIPNPSPQDARGKTFQLGSDAPVTHVRGRPIKH